MGQVGEGKGKRNGKGRGLDFERRPHNTIYR